MARRIALLFSGQGAQQVGMGRDLAEHFAAAANVFSEGDRVLARSLAQLAFNGPLEELTQTVNCQPALYLHGLAVWSVLRETIPDLPIVAAAGLSLGEFTAHAMAGTFESQTGLQLVATRSQLMDAACHETAGEMAAFVGGDESSVREIARLADVDVANLNAPGQIVLSGAAENIERAMQMAKPHGVRRAVPLTVAGAFHSRLMQSAEDQLRPTLEQAAMQLPRIPVVANVSARPAQSADEIRRQLAAQVTGSVRWVESIEYMLDELHCDLFLELGPGRVLAGLVDRIRKGTPVLSIENVSSLDFALKELREGS
jgi:[acyl-carrier-protein] S-malonyltransferase